MARLIAVVLILGSGWTLLTGSVPQVASGSWLRGPDLTEARTGGAAVLLDDGRVLLFGGRTSSGAATNAVQVMNAESGAWSDLGVVMLDPRSGHSATRLRDGRVLLAGGENSSGPLASLEIFDPQTGSFSFAGTLLNRRKDHGAALLTNGRVLILGGSMGQLLLNSSEVFDPESASVSAGSPMPFPRAGHSATTLLDGKVLIAGGRISQQDLASTLLYDPAAGSFVPGASLLQPRSGHAAVLLPHNNSVLISGGASAGVALSSAELYVPWMNRVTATAAMTLARRGAASSGLAQEGLAAVAGGSGLASSEFYGFATVQSDKDDYSPGETVVLSGRGWQPGETVTLRLQEAPATHGEVLMTAVADASGNIFHAGYEVEPHDIGVRYLLTASGSRSQAQTSFTDGNLASSIVFSLSPASAAPGGMLSFSAVAICQNGASPSDACAANGFVAGGSVPNGYLVIIEMGTSPSFVPAFTSMAGITLGGSLSDMIPAPSTPGTYYFRARHPMQSLPPNQWLAATSNAVMVTVTAPSSDAVAPETFLVNAPANPSSSASASFSFNGTDNVTPPAGLTFQCSLDGAAFSACSSPQSYLSLADGAHSFQVRARDAAGNFDPTPASFSWTIDTSAPVITPNVTGTLGTNGWYVSDVLVSWSVSDPGSGISSSTGCSAATLSSDTVGSTLTCSATNGAGLSSSASVTIKLDKSGPSAQLAVIAGNPGSNGWYVSDVTVDADGSDDVSGPVTCSADQVISAEGTTLVSGSCTNDAGLTTDAAPLSLMIDKSAPTNASGQADRTPDSNGWYNHAVTIGFTGQDAVSGIASCSSATYSGPDSASAAVSGSCTDLAGNSANGSFSLMYDATAPVLNPVVSPNPVVLNGSVTASANATDNLSGTAMQSCSPVVTSSLGSQTANCTATDVAGNSASASASYSVVPPGFLPAGTLCLGQPGHQVLSPLNASGTNVFQRGRTVPVKFRVCAANGVSVGPTAVVASFNLMQVIGGSASAAGNGSVESTNSDTMFRWSATDQMWSFNLSTRNLAAGATYVYRIGLVDGSDIYFQFTVK